MAKAQGAHAVAAQICEAALASRALLCARSDGVLTSAMRDAADHSRNSRRRLETIRTEILDTTGSHPAPALDTPAGARQFQIFLSAKIREIGTVLADAAADSRLQTTRLATAAGDYGVPARVRDHINRQALADDISRVENSTLAMRPAEMDRYNNALMVREGLALNSGDDSGPALLLTYDPTAFGGRGRAVIAIGDPDTADNTTVLVPGAGNSVRGGYLAQADGHNIYREANRADPQRSTAVIVWMGYRTPDSVFDPAVTQPAAARAGARLLANDVKNVAAAHSGASHVTVIGHSYGSTTVADAAALFGMRANDIVLVGSPGTDQAHHANDFHLPTGGHVYVGAASTDPITGFGGEPQLRVPATSLTVGLGRDPAADGYGSTRFKAEAPGVALPMSGHSSYFDPDSESLFSIGDIASGHGDALASHRMTALHRRRLPTFDPERLRLGTTPARH